MDLTKQEPEVVLYPLIGRTYQHYKGGRYEVITMATHTESNEAMVVYKSLLFGTIYTRPLKIWNSKTDNDAVRFRLMGP